ncbi:MAG: exodeoxyribonuclease VII small subunit [Candidatus Kerfeldbacteria bacterium RIFOXYA2_FULL_38_24]|uniref:Exodeoxyribonuclease 7 small subunit n=1 Tax=Candidatus Kerfeldbacteria bacterium RIFOXYB2_FULL_38_14 TaxID=1798547 RepID=A0A1G2BE66_9BACT|nr:MAG: exodeoxyribonuclease VII small subunit [Candidatus Kerfeldbacteria bacterium RIFOXYA2_FULL_38_24]OGY86540.1 MAG: exodeoxyribonuclease VII small subunit [Candidatus Kerfeldbacteria bacterium RIFOXYB2_FULL_38_14]OGY89058.1 MAG: exodeoxyribonuclease VII small subunit [Candidatus Kerfeldbacteria bacterium RIFOXYC2_FULL_38_9]
MPKKLLKNKQNSFSEQLKKLEEIVLLMEQKDVDLEDSVVKLEEGLKLAEKLKAILQKTENKIVSLKNKYRQN